MPLLVAVCAGNTTRSPLFAAAVRLYAPHVDVTTAMPPGRDTARGRSSAWAVAAFEVVARRSGQPADQVEVAIDFVRRHTSRRWHRVADRARQADAVYVFEAKHRDAVLEALPQLDPELVHDLQLKDKAHAELQRLGFPADTTSDAGRQVAAAYEKLAEALFEKARVVAADWG